MRLAAATIEQASDAHASFVEIEHAGHAPFLTHVDEVVAALDRFLSDAAFVSPAS